MSETTLPALKNPNYRVWRNVPTEERHERLQAIITRFVDGERLIDIAPSYGVSHAAICMALLEYAEDDWKRAQVAKALAELENTIDQRNEASDALKLARARDAEKSAQWKLERLCRRLFGQDAPESAGRVHISINLGDQARVIEPDVAVQTPEKSE